MILNLPLDLHSPAALDQVLPRVRPWVRERLPKAEEQLRGHPMVLTSLSRTLGHQAQLLVFWLDGRGPAHGIVRRPAPAGLSAHNPDFDGFAGALDIDGDPDSPGRVVTPGQQVVIDVMKNLGFVAGVDFAEKDPVHFEEPGYTRTLYEAYVLNANKLDRLAGRNL